MPGGKHVRQARTGPSGPFLVERGNLGSDNHATGVDFGLEHLTHQALAMSVAVCQGGIEERDPLIDGVAQGLTSCAVIDTAPLRAAQPPATEAELADDISRAADVPIRSLHDFILGSFAGHSHAAPRTPLVSPCAARTTRVATGSERAPAANRERGSTADVASC